jgi:ankyrin repeat protein
MRRIGYWIGFLLLCLLIVSLARLWYVTSNRVTPLIVAVEADDLEKVKTLVGRGANVNEKPTGIYQMPPLIVAIHNNATNSIEFLLQHGADVNITDSLGRTPLIWAVIRGADSNTYLVERLLSAGANVNHRDANGTSALRWARSLRSSPTSQTVTILKNAGAEE